MSNTDIYGYTKYVDIDKNAWIEPRKSKKTAHHGKQVLFWTDAVTQINITIEKDKNYVIHGSNQFGGSFHAVTTKSDEKNRIGRPRRLNRRRWNLYKYKNMLGWSCTEIRGTNESITKRKPNTKKHGRPLSQRRADRQQKYYRLLNVRNAEKSAN